MIHSKGKIEQNIQSRSGNKSQSKMDFKMFLKEVCYSMFNKVAFLFNQKYSKLQ